MTLFLFLKHLLFYFSFGYELRIQVRQSASNPSISPSPTFFYKKGGDVTMTLPGVMLALGWPQGCQKGDVIEAKS